MDEVEKLRREVAQLREMLNRESERQAYVYQIYVRNELVYVGKDSSFDQSRAQKHLQKARVLRRTGSAVDLYMAAHQESDIRIEKQNVDPRTVLELERTLIEQYQPRFNQTHTGRLNVCNHCAKCFKTSGWLSRHQLSCNLSQQQTE